jgi:hypothetical protein
MSSLKQMFESVFAAAAFAERGFVLEACALRDEVGAPGKSASETQPAARAPQNRPQNRPQMRV